jgi:hypothetical protein
MKKLILVVMAISSIASANRESGGRQGASAVWVAFSSFGTGPDSATEALLNQEIDLAKQNNRVVDYKYKQRGREGESVYCVDLRTSGDRVMLIKAIAPKIIADTKHNDLKIQRTRVYVGFDCKNIKAATEQDIKAYLD